MANRRGLIFDTIADVVAAFVHYDRIDDEYLPEDEIESAIEAGELTIDEIADCFASIYARH